MILRTDISVEGLFDAAVGLHDDKLVYVSLRRGLTYLKGKRFHPPGLGRWVRRPLPPRYVRVLASTTRIFALVSRRYSYYV